MKKKLGWGALIAAILALLFPGSPVQITNFGGGAGVIQARFATSSTVQVGQTSVVPLFPPTPGNGLCSKRVVQTSTSSPVYISMDNTATSTLQNSRGLYIAASTTAEFDAEDFGCEDWIVKGAGDGTTTPVYIMEFRQ